MPHRLSRREARQVRTAKVNRSRPRGQRVLVFDRVHPHCGATGFTVPDDLVEPDDGGRPMVRIDLDPGAAADHCYAEGRQLMPCTYSYSGGNDA